MNSENILSSLAGREMGISSAINFAHRFYSSESLVRRFQITKRLSFHEGCVNALSFNRSGSLLLTGSDDLKVCVWDWVHQKPACYFESRHKANVLQCRFMPFTNDCMIVTSGLDGQVRLAELDNAGLFQCSKRIIRHTGSCHKIIMNEQNPQCVLSCGEDAHIRLVDLRTPSQTLRSIIVVNESRNAVPLYSIAVRPLRPTEFAACGMDRWIRIFDYRFTKPCCGTLMKKFYPAGLLNSAEGSEIYSHVTSVAYSRDGEELIASYHNDSIFLFDVNHCNDEVDPLHIYKGHSNFDTVKGVNFYGSESEYIMSGSDCGHLFIWRKDTERIVWYAKADDSGPMLCICNPCLRGCLRNHQHPTLPLNITEPHPAFPLIATSGFDHCAKIWEPTRAEAVPLDKLSRVVEQNRLRESNLSDDADLLLRVLRPFRNRHSRNMRISQAMIIPMGIGNRSVRIPMELNDEVVELITAIGDSPLVFNMNSSTNSTDENSSNQFGSNQLRNPLNGDEIEHSSDEEDFGSTDADRAFGHRNRNRYARANRNQTRSSIRPRRRRRHATRNNRAARNALPRFRSLFHRVGYYPEILMAIPNDEITSPESYGQRRRSASNGIMGHNVYTFGSSNGFITDSDISIAFSSSTSSSAENSVDDAMDTD